MYFKLSTYKTTFMLIWRTIPAVKIKWHSVNVFFFLTRWLWRRQRSNKEYGKRGMGLRLDQRPFSKVTVVFAALFLTLFNRVLVSSKCKYLIIFTAHNTCYYYYKYCSHNNIKKMCIIVLLESHASYYLSDDQWLCSNFETI